MSNSLPCEILIEKLVSNSQKTLNSLRSEFLYEKSESVPSNLLDPQAVERSVPEYEIDICPEDKFRECKLNFSCKILF